MDHKKIAGEMLGEVSLSDEELRIRYRQAIEPEYWRGIYPGGAIEEPSSDVSGAAAVEVAAIDAAAAYLKRRGYFEYRNAIPARAVASMRGCVEAVVGAGWPAVFACLYDDFWGVSRTPPVTHLLRKMLGDDYRAMMWRFWCYYVPPIPGAGGWAPHVDSYRNGRTTINLWFALSDATLDNGCIYVVPRDLIYEAGAPKENPLKAEMLERDFYLNLLQSSRALPTPAGSVLGWDAQLIHWGSKCHAAGEPRISLACEFASRDFVPSANYREELLAADESAPLPAFEHRLRLIGRAIESYRSRDLRAQKFAELAKRLIVAGGEES